MPVDTAAVDTDLQNVLLSVPFFYNFTILEVLIVQEVEKQIKENKWKLWNQSEPTSYEGKSLCKCVCVFVILKFYALIPVQFTSRVDVCVTLG